MRLIAASLVALATVGAAPPVQAPAGVRIAAFECGRLVQPDLGRFNDTMLFSGERREFVAGCFLIRHPRGVLLWDTGLSAEMAAKSPDRMKAGIAIADRLKSLGLTPADVKHVGISHYHADHTGGAKAFPDAELLIGAKDWAAVQAMAGDDPQRAALKPWSDGPAKVTPVEGDRDVFGDGSVMMLTMPGHTPGHSALLVRTAKNGAVLISGDQYHFRENRPVRGVPTFNKSRAETLASHDRFEAIAKNLKARVVIQHDPRDLAAMPAFPRELD